MNERSSDRLDSEDEVLTDETLDTIAGGVSSASALEIKERAGDVSQAAHWPEGVQIGQL